MGKGKSKAAKLRESRESREMKLNRKYSPNMSSSARNLSKDDLGAVIFACKNHTFSECISNKIFGLPGPHYSYVQKISPGLTLFLFNCTDRTLHGVFEATTNGYLNMNSTAWAAAEGTELTPYPAQVRIKIRRHCSPLIEKDYQPLIADNYVTERKIWYELDKEQTNRLTRLFLESPIAGRRLTPKLNKEKASDSSHSMVTPPKPLRQDAYDPNFLHDAPMHMEMINGSDTAEKKWSELFKPSSSSSPLVQENEHGSKVKSWSDLLKTASSSHMMKDEEVSEIEKPNLSSLSVMENEEVYEVEQVNIDIPMSDYSETEWENETVYEEDPDIETKNISPFIIKNDEVSGINKPKLDPTVSDDSRSDCESDLSSSYETAMTFLDPWLDSLDEEQEDCREVRETVVTVHDHQEHSRSQHMFREGVHMDIPFSDGYDSLLMKLLQEIQGMKLCQINQSAKVEYLKHQLVDSKAEIEELKKCLDNLEPGLSYTGNYISEDDEKERRSEESVFIIGGSNGSKWLQDMDLYFPSEDKFVSLCPMTSFRSFATAASLNGEVYLVGGSHDGVWYDTVESYNPVSNQWIQRPSLNQKKGNLASVSVYDKIFAIGGGNGAECFSDVEIYDLILGRWIFNKPMLEKRVALAAADLDRVLYVSGGYDGRDYLRTVERFDAREAKWTRLSSMNSKRASHSLVAFNEKIYALGGYNANTMVSSVEVFDPRVGSWNMAESMILSRGYFGSFVLNGKLYAFGGLDEKQEVLDVVECYEEGGSGWKLHGQSSFSKRGFISTLVM